jgi:hypothetical protein
MILMMMRVDHDGWSETIIKFHKCSSPVGESGVDQQAIDKKGINPEKRDAQNPSGHPYGDNRTFLF